MNDEKYEVHPSISRALPPEPEVEQEPVVEAQPEAEAIAQPQIQPESDKEKNLRILRERAERAEREIEAMRIAQSKSQQQTASEDDDSIGIGSDDIVEGKHLSKVQKKLKKMEEELNQYKQQSQTATAEQRLKYKYPDFDKVVSRQNVEALTTAYPELAHTLQSSSDLYNVGVSAYELIKKFNIDQSYAPEVNRAQQNAAKPRPTNSISPQQGDTPLSRANAFANGLTEDLKAQLFKEMNEYRKGY